MLHSTPDAPQHPCRCIQDPPHALKCTISSGVHGGGILAYVIGNVKRVSQLPLVWFRALSTTATGDRNHGHTQQPEGANKSQTSRKQGTNNGFSHYGLCFPQTPTNAKHTLFHTWKKIHSGPTPHTPVTLVRQTNRYTSIFHVAMYTLRATESLSAFEKQSVAETIWIFHKKHRSILVCGLVVQSCTGVSGVSMLAF